MSITAENRSFKYGDGLFETFRVVQGTALFLEDHFERLQRGLTVLGIQAPEGFSPQWLQNIITDHVKQYADAPARRIRITFWRAAGGLYSPTNHQLEYHIESTPLAEAMYQLSPGGLQVSVYSAIRLHHSIISGLKTTSALPYVLAGKFRLEQKLDECFLLDIHDNVVEGVASNIFIKKKETIYTPPLSSGCVGGVLRKNLIRLIKESPFTLSMQPIKHFELKDVEEIWMTNSIRGIQWVHFNFMHPTQSYDKRAAQYFVHQLNDYINGQIVAKNP